MSYRCTYSGTSRIVFGALFGALVLDLLLYAVYSIFVNAVELQDSVAFLVAFWVFASLGFVLLAHLDSAGQQHPAHMLDLAHALRWLITYARSFGADPSQIYLCGHSAGALMVTLLSQHDDLLAEVGLDREKLAACVRGVIGISGPYNPAAIYECESLLQFAWRHLNGLHFFGYPKDRLADASPLSYLKPTRVAYLLVNAESDLGLAGQASDLTQAMNKLQIRCDHRIIGGSTHRSIIRRLPSELVQILVNFIQQESKLADFA